MQRIKFLEFTIKFKKDLFSDAEIDPINDTLVNSQNFITFYKSYFWDNPITQNENVEEYSWSKLIAKKLLCPTGYQNEQDIHILSDEYYVHCFF